MYGAFHHISVPMKILILQIVKKNWIRWEWAQRPYQVGSPNLDFGISPICCHFSRLGRSFILNFNLTHHYISISARNLFKI